MCEVFRSDPDHYPSAGEQRNSGGTTTAGTKSTLAQPAQIAQTSAQYQAVYGAVPTPTDASPEVRDLIDSTDAAAQAALKRAIEIDALATWNFRPPTSEPEYPKCSARKCSDHRSQADAWLVRANAYTQSATADLMRIQALSLPTRVPT